MKSRTEHVRDLFLRVADDLKVAVREAATADPVATAVCFHSQQAAEKVLKTWLEWRGEVPPRVHSLSVLLTECVRLDPVFAPLWDVRALTPYSVEARYAVGADRPSVDEAREALALALKAVRFIVEQRRAEGVDVADLLPDLPEA
jgi:HEPN domain-containing protein